MVFILTACANESVERNIQHKAAMTRFCVVLVLFASFGLLGNAFSLGSSGSVGKHAIGARYSSNTRQSRGASSLLMKSEKVYGQNNFGDLLGGCETRVDVGTGESLSCLSCYSYYSCYSCRWLGNACLDTEWFIAKP